MVLSGACTVVEVTGTRGTAGVWVATGALTCVAPKFPGRLDQFSLRFIQCMLIGNLHTLNKTQTKLIKSAFYSVYADR